MNTDNTLLHLINNMNGKIIENDFEDLNEDVPLKQQLILLDEDMLMIEFDNNLILNVGWHANPDATDNYVQYKSTGKFVVCVIEDQNWENVLQKIFCTTLNELKVILQKLYSFISTFSHQQENLYLGPSHSSKYKPDLDIQELELYAWHYGKKVTNGKNWKVFKFDFIVGAMSGKETLCVLIKCKNNTIHGHPILECEYLELIGYSLTH